MEAMKNITIKVSCDGTQLSQKVKVVNFVFNIINEKIKAATATGCYRIGILSFEDIIKALGKTILESKR